MTVVRRWQPGRRTVAVLAAALIVLPVGAFAFVKPVRVVAPEWAGVTCISPQVCVENLGREAEAQRLYRDAARNVQTDLSPFHHLPRVIFCTTPRCFAWFGGGKDAARTVLTLGIVVGPRGWQDYYVRHEMIHHWQAEQLGWVDQWRLPTWLREGMAYAMSGDPRHPLAEPLETYRARFLAWNAARGARPLVQALRDSL